MSKETNPSGDLYRTIILGHGVMMPRVKCLVCGKKIRVPVSLEIVWEGVDQVLKSSPDTDRLWTHYEKHVLKGEW
jgi:hypothetical protein